MVVAPGIAAAAGAVTGGFFAGGLHAVAGKFSCVVDESVVFWLIGYYDTLAGE